MAVDIVHTTVTLPDAVYGVPYEAALSYKGNATALSASTVASGALPTGLALDAALPFARITGTPTALGTFTFTIGLADAPDTSVSSGTLTIRVREYSEKSDGPSLSAANNTAAAVKKLRFP